MGQMKAADQVAGLLREYWDAEEARDVDRVLTFWDDDGEFVDRLGGVLRGHEALRSFYTASFERFPRASVTLRQVIGTPRSAAVQYNATLWDVGGQPYDVRVVVIVSCSRHRITRLESYFDSAAFGA